MYETCRMNDRDCILLLLFVHDKAFPIPSLCLFVKRKGFPKLLHAKRIQGPRTGSRCISRPHRHARLAQCCIFCGRVATAKSRVDRFALTQVGRVYSPRMVHSFDFYPNTQGMVQFLSHRDPAQHRAAKCRTGKSAVQTHCSGGGRTLVAADDTA